MDPTWKKAILLKAALGPRGLCPNGGDGQQMNGPHRALTTAISIAQGREAALEGSPRTILGMRQQALGSEHWNILISPRTHGSGAA